LRSLSAGAEATAAVAAFTAVVEAVASAAAVEADFMVVASAVVVAPHSVVAGVRMADHLAARIVGVVLIAAEDSHRAVMAARHIAADSARDRMEDSDHAALVLAAGHSPARTAVDSAVRAASAAQAGSEPAMPSRTADGIRSAAAAEQ
jgi:hypothetical protein